MKELTGGLGADVAIEAVGVPETFELCTDLIRPGGRVANVGVHGHAATLHLEKLWIQDVTITTGLVDTVTTPILMQLIELGKLDPTLFATHRFALEDTMAAYDTFSAAAESNALKVVLGTQAAGDRDAAPRGAGGCRRLARRWRAGCRARHPAPSPRSTSSCATGARCGSGRRRARTSPPSPTFFRALSPQSLYPRFHGTVAVDDALSERFVDPDFVGARRADRRHRRRASSRSRTGRACATRCRRRRRSPSRTSCRGTASARACSSGSPRSPARRASSASSPRCCPSNVSMLRVFAGAGLEVRREIAEGDVEIEFPIAPTARLRRRASTRATTSPSSRRCARSSSRGPSPSSAPRARRGTIGGELFRNVLRRRLRRRRVPGQPQRGAGRRRARVRVDRGDPGRARPRRHLRSRRARPAPRPSRRSRAGVRALCVISAGFAELGARGTRAPGARCSRSCARTARGCSARTASASRPRRRG